MQRCTEEDPEPVTPAQQEGTDSFLMNASPLWYNINYRYAPTCFQSLQTFTLQ